MRALITARFDEMSRLRLAELTSDMVFAGFGTTRKKLTVAELKAHLADVDILIIEFESITREVLEAAPRLKVLVCCRNEPEANVDVAVATELGIPVLFTPGRNAVSVAEYTMGLMLSVTRHIAVTHHLMRYTSELTQVAYEDKMHDRRGITSEWSLDPAAPFNHFSGPELSGKTLGLVGFGAIGRQVARRAQAFDMGVIVADPYVDPEICASLQVEKTDLTTLMQVADFVVMAAKVTPQTRGLVNRQLIDAMKPTAYLINTARAALVDYGALFDALRDKRIAGAALDVYPIEPIPADSPFLTLDNVVLSPHLAGASSDIPSHHSEMAVDDLVRLFNGERPVGFANPKVWERRRSLGVPGNDD